MPAQSPRQHTTSLLAVGSGAVLLLVGLLPIVNWIGGGANAEWYSSRLDEWLTGTVIVLGTVALLLVVERRVPIWREGAWSRIAARAANSPLRTGALIILAAFAVYLAVAFAVFDGVPLHLDELAQVFQARVFASGVLTAPLPTRPEFSSVLHLVDAPTGRFSQYPPGGPLMLVPGVWLGSPAVMNPLIGAVSTLAMWGILRRTQRETVALAGTLLFAFAPFVVFMSGSHMNHVAALMWVLVATYAYVRILAVEEDQPRWGFLAGLALGMCASVRPVDALAFALPLGTLLLLRAIRTRHLIGLIASGAGVAIPLALTLWFNTKTTGNPLLFAYELQWGKEHGLGFHVAPWGDAHTPLRGLELISLYLLRLQTYLFETPVPSLLFPAIALLLTRRLGDLERYWVISGALLLALYLAYWHDGFYLGPRFVFLLAPPLALFAAQLPGLLHDHWRKTPALAHGTMYGALVCLVMAGALAIPQRAAQYASGLRTMRLNVPALAKQQGITNALIFVRESWGSQLIARMWARGVSRSATEFIYRSSDACELEHAISDLEAKRIVGAAATQVLMQGTERRGELVRSTMSPDDSERMRPGARYDALCMAHITEDRRGFTLFAPLMAVDWGTNVYARDLGERNRALIQENGQRKVYLLTAASSEPDAPLAFIPAR